MAERDMVSERAPRLAGLPDRWHRAPRRWGHDIHSICSYMAMFPPSMPHVFIEWLTEPGDVVFDPFCGRGTAPAEACLMGRTGLGSDLNPLAVVLTGAKVDPPTRRQLANRLEQLERRREVWDTSGAPDIVQPLFHPTTLGELLWLRAQLDVKNRTDRFLMAVLLGSLHLNADKAGVARGLTVAMPNTFAMAPGYVSRYITEHQLIAPQRNVVEFLKERTERVEVPSEPFTRGRAWAQDATQEARWPRRIPKAKLIFSSPPYLQVIFYGKFNWIRLWLLGCDGWDLDKSLFTSGSLEKYTDFMREAIGASAAHLRDDGIACFVIGDVNRRGAELNLAAAVAEQCVPEQLRVIDVIADKIPRRHKVSRIWKDSPGRATKTDRILILAGPAAELGGLKRFRWSGSNAGLK